MAITLTVIDGPHKGKDFSFSEHDTFLVGRSPEAHFRLADKDTFISRTHFLIEVNPPLCRLVDMNSQNGTYVNGQRVESVDLQDGDQIKAGHTVFHVAIGAPASGDEAQCSSPSEDTVEYLPKDDQPPVPGLDMEGIHTVTGYRLVRELGRGNMGIVYLAERDADKARVALKTITPAVATSRIKLERFLREAEILRQLDHPNIVAFREIGVSRGRIFFVMDFIEGPSAAELLDKHGPFPIRTAVKLMCQLLQALEYAHDKGFVHRDIKPGNILVPLLDGKRRVKLADFGLAKTYRASQLSGLTIHGKFSGTIPFMPPEQILSFRKVQPPSDQYSAAATLYNLLTDQYIFDFPDRTVDALSMVLEGTLVPITQRRADIPNALAEVIHRALARKPEDRFPHVREMYKALLPYSRK